MLLRNVVVVRRVGNKTCRSSKKTPTGYVDKKVFNTYTPFVVNSPRQKTNQPNRKKKIQATDTFYIWFKPHLYWLECVSLKRNLYRIEILLVLTKNGLPLFFWIAANLRSFILTKDFILYLSIFPTFSYFTQQRKISKPCVAFVQNQHIHYWTLPVFRNSDDCGVMKNSRPMHIVARG